MTIKTDGQAMALKLLRRLHKFNWDCERPSGSARLVHHTLLALNNYPSSERLRFARVISDWLVTEVLGCCQDLKKYEAVLSARRAEADPHFQRFIGKLNIDGPRSAAG